MLLITYAIEIENLPVNSRLALVGEQMVEREEECHVAAPALVPLKTYLAPLLSSNLVPCGLDPCSLVFVSGLCYCWWWSVLLLLVGLSKNWSNTSADYSFPLHNLVNTAADYPISLKI
jgi:hypothetical protein